MTKVTRRRPSICHAAETEWSGPCDDTVTLHSRLPVRSLSLCLEQNPPRFARLGFCSRSAPSSLAGGCSALLPLPGSNYVTALLKPTFLERDALLALWLAGLPALFGGVWTLEAVKLRGGDPPASSCRFLTGRHGHGGGFAPVTAEGPKSFRCFLRNVQNFFRCSFSTCKARPTML